MVAGEGPHGSLVCLEMQGAGKGKPDHPQQRSGIVIRLLGIRKRRHISQKVWHVGRAS